MLIDFPAARVIQRSVRNRMRQAAEAICEWVINRHRKIMLIYFPRSELQSTEDDDIGQRDGQSNSNHEKF